MDPQTDPSSPTQSPVLPKEGLSLRTTRSKSSLVEFGSSSISGLRDNISTGINTLSTGLKTQVEKRRKDLPKGIEINPKKPCMGLLPIAEQAVYKQALWLSGQPFFRKYCYSNGQTKFEIEQSPLIYQPIRICTSIFLWMCSIPRLWPLLIPYLIWVFYIDRAPVLGGRPKRWLRRMGIWKHFANYYPVSLVQEASLPLDRKYIFGYHPHGVIGMGAFAKFVKSYFLIFFNGYSQQKFSFPSILHHSFATEGTNFSKIFPGIEPHLLTLAPNFKIPLYRDLLLLLGMCSVSKRSCSSILRKGPPGTAIVIVVGGATESLRAHPGTADLTLKSRMGFIKIAINEGVDLVPVFSFGENDIYDQLANERGTQIYKLQKRFQSIFGFTLPLFHGRGLFNYSVGLMPYRQPIVSVAGRPIRVVQCNNPTSEQLQETQGRYIEELLRIWDTYKDVYARNRTKELTLVD
ncbi:diacylglycerol o-acyltransferase [Phaffia rhodozyma]|uniref:Diacylglycerol O-acyltransferase n=1 Tax=Phaffia rhodozyma TaxID=264483 RepID=A0A0F7SG92_PHARH|nr:diacylglycerol o-acyltransferase [Phaffia rhodozyma]